METTNHKPSKCPKCGSELQFIEYGSKMGSNGKPAKWPIYEKCHNKECSLGRRNLGLPEPVEDMPAYEPLPEVRSIIPTRLYQLPMSKNYDHVYFAMIGCLKVSKNDMRSRGMDAEMRVYMHWRDIEYWAEKFSPDLVVLNKDEGYAIFKHPVKDNEIVMVKEKNIKVTKGYRYMTIELHSRKEEDAETESIEIQV